ncbi:MBL fold metallo-hydrolase [Rhodococcus koreensis]
MIATGNPQQDAWSARRLPAVERIAPDVWAVPVPTPGLPVRYTLCYVIADQDGCVLIDPGLDTDESWAALVDGVAECGFDVALVSRVLITHMHPDHFGLAPRVLEHAPRARVLLHVSDADLVRSDRSAFNEARMTLWRSLMATTGCPDSVRISERALTSPRLAPAMMDRVDFVADGDCISTASRTLTAWWTPGHTPGHLCFADEHARMLFSGDHLLPTISPNISQLHHLDDDVLARYLTSLDRVALDDEWEVLPAHQFRFHGARERVHDLCDHHADRLDEIRAVLDERGPTTCYDVACALTWHRPIGEQDSRATNLAVKETLAHLVHLRGQGHAVLDAGERWRLNVSTESAANERSFV